MSDDLPDQRIPDVEEVLDALESMAEQYLTTGHPDLYHAFMSAGKEACFILCRARPERWKSTPSGARRIDGA